MTDEDYLMYPEAKAMVTSRFDPIVVTRLLTSAHERRIRAERRAIRERFGYIPKGWFSDTPKP